MKELPKELDETLQIVCEECAEVQQIYSKCRRHGLLSNNNGLLPKTNVEHLKEELGQLVYVLAYAISLLSLSEKDLLEIGERKKQSLRKYSSIKGVH